ncbi:MAG: LamG domain-containing protein, partial [Dehalococcoidia bacterium]|nr:LamG domain-containing protein [Dehalococcoidia bacterium]
MGTSDFTIMFWLNLETNSSSGVQILKGKAGNNDNAGYEIKTGVGSSCANSSMRFILNIGSGGASGSRGNCVTNPETDTWTHFTWVGDRDGNMTVYRDGVVATSVENPRDISDWEGIDISNSEVVNLGRRYTEGSYMEGKLDEVRIYKRALSADEVRTHYLQGGSSNGYVMADAFKVINTSAEELLRVNSSGNLGIGITSPLAALDIEGSASLSANLSLRGSGTAHTFDILDNGSLNFRKSPGGSEQTTSMFIQGDGKVGIGNTAPGAMLSVGSSTPALISSAGLVTVANITDSTSGSTGSINTLGGLGVTKDLAVDGGDFVTAATTFNLINATATTVNFAGAATTLSIGAATGTVTLNNATTAITGALTANGDVTLGNEITDNITFTGRVAVDSDLIPIGTTGTNDLGSTALPWDNLYVDNIFAATTGTSGYWQRNSQALSPTNITDDVLIGGT